LTTQQIHKGTKPESYAFAKMTILINLICDLFK